MGGNMCSKGTDQCETEVPQCSCSGDQAIQGTEGDEREKTSPIKLQYDTENPNKLVDFGAKLETNSKGVHRLIEVEDGGLAQQLELKDGDVIIELNGTDITDVFHGALVLTLRDIGTKVHFIVNRTDAKSFYQGAVFFRLGPTDDGGNGARIAYKYSDFKKGKHIARPVLPPDETVPLLNKYALQDADCISLQFTGPCGGVRKLEILNSGANFAPSEVRVCMYKYQQKDSTGPKGTIAAFAAIPHANKDQYGICTKGTGAGPVDVQVFPTDMKKTNHKIPAWMKKKKQRITENNFFFLTQTLSSDVTISPIAELGLYLTANVDRDYEAEVETSVNGVLKIANSSDCSKKCIIYD